MSPLSTSPLVVLVALAFGCTAAPPAPSEPFPEGAAPRIEPAQPGSDGGAEAAPDPVEPSVDAGVSARLTVQGPCPPLPEPCRILPMGDSITFGVRATPTGPTSSGGYRRYLRRALRDAGRTFEYVGACPGHGGRCRIPPSGEPPYCFPGGAPELGQHDGHPGWDINAFRARTGGACPGSVETFLSRVRDGSGRPATPHIVLLMVGANDVRAGSGIRQGAARRFGYLLDELLAALPPTTRVVVGTVTPNLVGTNDRDGVRPFNRAVRAIVAARRRAGREVQIVDTYGAIAVDASGRSPDLSSDRLHPNERGYRKIARRWLEAIAPLVR